MLSGEAAARGSSPGPGVRALGYTGKDLKHPDSIWFDLNETIAWSEQLSEEIAIRPPASKVEEV